MQQWGCDTCRVMYPAQPVMQPFALAMTPNKRSKGLVIGISVAAVVGAGVAITLIAINHGKKPTAAVASGSGAASDDSATAPSSTPPVAPIDRKPPPTKPPPPAPPKDTTLGTPEPLELADLWLWPRKDGAYLVASPVLEVVFPHRPTTKVESKPVEAYTLADDLQGRGLLQLQILARDIASPESLRAVVGKAGPVTETKRTDRGADVTRFEATSAATGETLRIDSRVDAMRGLALVATTSFIKSDQATADAFLDSIHTRVATDPFDDPKTLTVRVRKERGKNQAHDATDSFTIDLPWTAKVARTPPQGHVVGVRVTAARGKASVVLDVAELSSWAALAISPGAQQAFVEQARAGLATSTGLDVKIATEKLGGIAAARLDAKGRGHSYHTHLVWNRYQHRRYTLACIDAPCDVVALSLKFADPAPVR